MSTAMIGQRIGNYQITKLLATGGMGAVYLAEHPGIGRRVAVKVLLPEVASDEEMVRRFFNEARAAHAIRHPGIVEILDFGTLPEGTSYIVMELLEGETLAARLRRVERLRIETAVDFAVQAAEALGAAHAQRIVHRDLKPDNLFLVPDARRPGHELVKLLDFGIAKLAGGPGGAGSFKTRTGVLMGTPVYMSPEQCLGTKEIDHRTDIYALGVILFQMLTGSPPFMSEGHGELIHLHISAVPPRMRARDPRIPERLDAAVARALAKDPAHRPQSMAELVQLLEGRATFAWSAPTPVVDLGAMGATPPAAAPGPADRARVPSTTLSASASFVDREIAKLRGRRWVAPLVVGSVLLGGALAAVFALKPGPLPVSTPAPTTATPTVVPLAPAPSEPRPQPRVEPAAITVALASQPSGARIVRERDQAVIGVTPFKESWSPGAGTERLRLELPGYRPESVIVPLDRGAELSFTLAREPRPARSATKRPGRGRPTAAPRAEPVPL